MRSSMCGRGSVALFWCGQTGTFPPISPKGTEAGRLWRESLAFFFFNPGSYNLMPVTGPCLEDTTIVFLPPIVSRGSNRLPHCDFPDGRGVVSRAAWLFRTVGVGWLAGIMEHMEEKNPQKTSALLMWTAHVNQGVRFTEELNVALKPYVDCFVFCSYKTSKSLTVVFYFFIAPSIWSNIVRWKQN